jgi:hypothetical protein
MIQIHRLIRLVNPQKLILLYQEMKRIGDSINILQTQVEALTVVQAELVESVHTKPIVTVSKGEKLRVVFLAHHPTSWSATKPVVDAMLNDKRYEVTVVSLPHFYLMCRGDVLDGEEFMHKILTEQKLPHIRISTESIGQCLTLLKRLKPHAIFRQTPWNHDLPVSLSGKNLSFTRLCYIPYGYMTAAIQEKQFNQEFHWFCYQIFWPDVVHLEMSQKYSMIKAVNGSVSGYPKFDHITCATLKYTKNTDFEFHLIWAPHWSYEDGWLRFGALWETAEQMYSLAKENNMIKTTLRPHPVLLEKIKTDPDIRLKEFIRKWEDLKNTSISEEADYVQLFAESDAMVTDGLSFLSEYQLLDKPIIFFSRHDSIGFNEAGIKLIDGVYKVQTRDELASRLVKIMNNEEDLDIVIRRREIAAAIQPYPGHAATNILEILYSKLMSESKSS